MNTQLVPPAATIADLEKKTAEYEQEALKSAEPRASVLRAEAKQ